MAEYLPSCCEAPASVPGTLKTNLNSRRPYQCSPQKGLFSGAVVLCWEECSNFVWACGWKYSDRGHVYSAGPCALTWSGCSTQQLGALLLLHDTLRLALEEYPQLDLGSIEMTTEALSWQQPQAQCAEKFHPMIKLFSVASGLAPQEIVLEAESSIFSIILRELVQLVCTTISSVWFLACHMLA